MTTRADQITFCEQKEAHYRLAAGAFGVFALQDAEMYQSIAATLRADREAAPAPPWQPIETAPTDGESILVHDEGAVMIAWWDADISAWVDHGPMSPPPQHWMPLPQPPGAARPGVAVAPQPTTAPDPYGYETAPFVEGAVAPKEPTR